MKSLKMSAVPCRIIVPLVLFSMAVVLRTANAHQNAACTLESLKDIAKNACDHLSDKFNETHDPFHRGRDSLGFHLSHGPTGARNRRHTLHHEYHKLNTRLRHGSRGYMELSYSSSLYKLVKHRFLSSHRVNSVSEWTANFLSSKGFNATIPPIDTTLYHIENNEVDQDEVDFVPYNNRHKRFSKKDESLESMRNRRANDIQITYCCEHSDSARCNDWLCYI